MQSSPAKYKGSKEIFLKVAKTPEVFSTKHGRNDAQRKIFLKTHITCCHKSDREN